MNITIEDYLKILYPNPDILDDKEKKQYLKDKVFLEEHIDDTNRFYSRFLKSKEDLGVSELEYTQEIMDMAKKKFDKETIIVEYVDYMLSVLDKNSFIQNDFETFINLLYIDQSYQEEYKNESIDTTPIKLEEVFKFTEEFLSEIDDSKEMVTEFKNLRDSEKIIIVSSDEKIGSKYKDGKIIYEFDGTIDSANTLVHEFMHHWMDFKGNPTLNRELYTMFNEFLPIYYENAFIKYLDNKAILKYGEKPLIASRLKFEKEKDTNNVLIKLLELTKILKEKGEIGKEDIIDVLEKYTPENTTREDLWKNEADKIKEFCEEHFLGSETISGPVMYRLNNGLALNTNYDIETVKKIYKLAEFVRDRNHDVFFMEEYNRITQSKDLEKTTYNERNIRADDSKSVTIQPEEIAKLAKNLRLDSQEMNQAESVLKQGERSLDNQKTKGAFMNFIDKIKNLFNRNKTKALSEPENNDYNYTSSDFSNQTNNSWVLGNNGYYQEPLTKLDNDIINFLNNYYQKVSQINSNEPLNNYKIAYSSVVQSNEFVTNEEYNYNYARENQLLNNMKMNNRYSATEENGFYHVQSQGYQMPNFKDMTRVYVNCKNGNISDVAQMLTDYNTNPNFYMKFVSNQVNAQGPRNEKIVIYCNKNELDYTLGLVRDCQSLNPHCFAGTQSLPFLKNEQGIATVANQPETDQYKNLYGQTKTIPQSVNAFITNMLQESYVEAVREIARVDGNLNFLFDQNNYSNETLYVQNFPYVFETNGDYLLKSMKAKLEFLSKNNNIELEGISEEKQFDMDKSQQRDGFEK